MMVSYRRGGMNTQKGNGLADLNINPTTIWTPQTGFLKETGNISAGYQYQPQTYSVYDAPGLLLPAPACTQAAEGAFVSAGCVDQALAVQQENFKRTADYNAGILTQVRNAPVAPPTPPAGAGGAAGPCQTGWHKNAAGTGCDADSVATPPKTPASTPSPGGGGSTDKTTTGGYIDSATGFFTEGVDVGGFNLPMWGLLAAGVGALLLFKGGR